MAQIKLYVGTPDESGLYNVYGIEPQSGEHVDFAYGMRLEDAGLFVKASNRLLDCQHPLTTLYYHAPVSANHNDFRCGVCNQIIQLPPHLMERWAARPQAD